MHALRLVSAVSVLATGGATYLSSPTQGWAQPVIEEIIVTTRRRSENLQDVPIAVEALSAQQIQRLGITDLDDITRLSSSVQFDTSYGPADTRLTVRGLSNSRGRSNVAFLVDGIDVTTENFIAPGSGLLANQRLLNDLERIEVVKGPQSALYGRAAFSGAFNYITKEPGEDLDGQLGLDIAEDGMLEINGSVGGPVIEDILGLRLNGVYWTEDGHYENSISGENVGGGEGAGLALTGVYTPTESMKFKGRLAYSDDEYDPQPTVRLPPDTTVRFPQEAFDAGIGRTDAFGGAALSIWDFGSTFDLPSSFGNASGRVITHGEDPLTGQDYEGTQMEVFRASLVFSWDIPGGLLSSYTGYTDADLTDEYDQDYQAVGRPDTLIGGQQARTFNDTEQFSQELRFASNWDSPLQLTLGGLYWSEERSIAELNYIVSCLPITKPVVAGIATQQPGVCDGTPGGFPTNTLSVTSWQEYARSLEPRAPQNWSGDTDHLSIYAMLEWSVSEKLKLTLENRYVDEHFDIVRPNQSGCTNLGFAVDDPDLPGNLFRIPLRSENDPDNPFDARCESEDFENPMRDWALISGTTKSHFHTPKVTLEYIPTDSAMVYFSWAKAQKPGGINTVAAGGDPVEIDGERFEPEKMDAWELGTKTSWAAAGNMILNGAVFFQDYTDKQVGTQRLGTDGRVQPRTENAAAAEVWGLEIEVSWLPEAVEGLSMSLGYTWLDAEYKSFNDDTGLVVRAGIAGECPVVYKGGLGPNPDDLSDPANGNPFCRLDRAGNDLERTPQNSLVTAIALQRPLFNTGLEWYAEANAIYQDERWLDQDNFLKWEDFWLVDARLGLESFRWDAQLYVRNLFDDDSLKSGGFGPDFAQQVSELGFVAGLGNLHYFGPLPDPRVFGFRVNYRFD